MRRKFTRVQLLLAAFLLVCANFAFLSNITSAATLTNTYIRLTRMKAGATSDLRVVFKTTANAGATGFTVDFNGADSSSWTGSSGSVTSGGTGWTVTAVAGCDVGATAAAGSPTASGSGAVLTIASVTALSANTTYCWDITHSGAAVTNATAGEYHPVITETGGATDSTTVALRTVSDDQVVVNATVPPSFNFALSCPQSSPNRDNFTANLSTSSVGSTTGCDVTVNTNATTGWLAWASDANTGLHSALASTTIASKTPGTNTTLSSNPGTAAYIFSVSSVTNGGGGTITVANAYGNGSGAAAGANQGSGLDTSIRQIASSDGTAASAAIHVKSYAAINATTPAANDYTDTVTLIGAGNF